jgi:hypothetical protein
MLHAALRKFTQWIPFSTHDDSTRHSHRSHASDMEPRNRSSLGHVRGLHETRSPGLSHFLHGASLPPCSCLSGCQLCRHWGILEQVSLGRGTSWARFVGCRTIAGKLERGFGSGMTSPWHFVGSSCSVAGAGAGAAVACSVGLVAALPVAPEQENSEVPHVEKLIH